MGLLPLGLISSRRELFQFISTFAMPVGLFFGRKCMFSKDRSLLLYLMFIVYHLQAYHSTLSAPNSLCKMALLSINTKFKGPAPPGGTTLSCRCIIRKNAKSYVFIDVLLKPIFSFLAQIIGIVCLFV